MSNRGEGSRTPVRPQPPLFAIFWVSATALAYEILLMRLFSIIQWHHFAYMMISLALLGYGASGTFVTVFQGKLLGRFQRNYLICLLLFAFSISTCFLLAQSLQFNAVEILWDIRQFGKLLLLYLLLALPFFLAACSMALALLSFRGQVAGVYAADLLGAAAGSGGVVVLLYLVFPGRALLFLVAMGATAVVMALLELKVKSLASPLALLMLFLVHVLLAGALSRPVISPYKGLAQALRLKGARIIEQKSSPLALLSVVENPLIPWRFAPGVSLNSTIEPPEQLALFTDADNMTVISRFDGDYEKVAYLDQQTSALAYHLQPLKTVLIVGAGGGSGILQAGMHQVERIEALEINPQVVAIGKNHGAFSGNIFANSSTAVHLAEARGFISQSKKRFDLIQIELLDSFNASAAGLYALNEGYLYTVEALEEYISHLSASGYLSISRWLKVPPRDSLKLFATALVALEKLGSEAAEKQLILIRGWQTTTLLIKNGAVTAAEIEALKRFCRERSFDLAYYPGISAKETNRYNILQEPYFYLGAQALSRERADFFRRYKFNIAPATDDRPYFFHFLKAGTIPEIIALRGQGGLPLMEQGYLILVATLFQAGIASIVLILLPLLLAPQEKRPPGGLRLQVFLYFFSIGLGFLFLEISFMQKFLLFLQHPLFAAALVVTAFLFFAGLGSAATRKLLRKYEAPQLLRGSLSLLLLLGFVSLPLLERLLALLLSQTLFVKMVVTMLVIAPFGFCMGMPFPLALARLARAAPALIPWAWGINGCASVISAVSAMLCAVHFGFRMVIITALLFYGVAILTFPGGSGRMSSGRREGPL